MTPNSHDTQDSPELSTSTPSLLALSFYFPPANNPRAVQVERLLRNLDLPTALVCADYDQQDERMDHRESAIGEFLTDCVRVPFVETGWQKLASRFSHRFDPLLLDKRPDRYIYWKPAVINAVEELLTRRSKPSALVSFGSPMSDHIIGLELSKRFGLPWMAHFSDPWVDNIFKSFNPLTRSINLSLERKVMETANRLIFTSEETVDLVMRKYPPALREKARVLPHAYEGASSDEETTSSSPNITLRYIGDMYGQRTPAPLFKALQRIVATEPKLLKDVHFEFVGSMHDLNLSEMGLSELPEDLVKFRATVSYAESLRLMKSADGLLVIDAPAETSVFLPSKLIDYVGAGRPVLGITPPGTASTLIKNLGGWVSDPANAAMTEQMLKEFIGFTRSSRTDGKYLWGTPAIRERFDARRVAHQFEEFVRELVS